MLHWELLQKISMKAQLLEQFKLLNSKILWQVCQTDLTLLLVREGFVCLAGNVNGHPADWQALRALAQQHKVHLLEDSTEAIGSVYQGQCVGQVGDVSIFDFSQPSALTCGEGGMLVTDDEHLARELRYLRVARCLGYRLGHRLH